MILIPDRSRKSLITLVCSFFFVIHFHSKEDFGKYLRPKGEKSPCQLQIITVSCSQIASVTRFQSISFPPPPMKR